MLTAVCFHACTATGRSSVADGRAVRAASKPLACRSALGTVLVVSRGRAEAPTESGPALRDLRPAVRHAADMRETPSGLSRSSSGFGRPPPRFGRALRRPDRAESTRWSWRASGGRGLPVARLDRSASQDVAHLSEPAPGTMGTTGYFSYTARTLRSGSDRSVPTRRTPCLKPRLIR